MWPNFTKKAIKPQCVDKAAADGFVKDWLSQTEGVSLTAAQKRALGAVLEYSPFLRDMAARHPDVVVAVLHGEVPSNAPVAIPVTASQAEVMAQLRRLKQRAALAVGLADALGMWSLEEVTGALSRLADTATEQALGWIVAQDGRTADTCGLFVLAMGKWGAQELNYSSDIDFIVFYEPALVGGDEPATRAIRWTRQLVKLLEERTADGYVFRTDVRLRPDPASTPVAISMDAAESYYSSLALTWERAAMIKARAAAGDSRVADDFAAMIRPFIWRRSLDFTAIEDVYNLKQRLHDHKGYDDIILAGYNIKIGRGGIRDIEFMAQTPQLIWGGRDAALRQRGTVVTLRALAAAGHMQAAIAEELIAAYIYLRTLEHRVQLVYDQQTHSLPEGEDEQVRLAAVLGFANVCKWRAATQATLERVAEVFDTLLAPPQTIITPPSISYNDDALMALGFHTPAPVLNLLQEWQRGNYRALRSPKARERFQALLPAILTKLGETTNPELATINFDRFLSKLSAGVQLFALLQANPPLIQALADIMGDAPRLAQMLGEFPYLLESFLVARHDDLDAEIARLPTQLATCAHAEETLRLLRRWLHEQQFLVGMRLFRGGFDITEVTRDFTRLADAAVQHLYQLVEADFAAQHGRFAGGGMVVVALGKQGSFEMTMTSDLDLVFIYQVPHGAVESDGARPLSVTVYFARLAQRLVSALTTPMAEGAFFKVDMRLRPSGNAGPVAVSLDAFRKYQMESAWVWEHMALTRARPVAGDAAVAAKVAATITDVLTQPRDPTSLMASALAMHHKIVAAHKPRDVWHVKYVRGGLVDIDFMVQYWQLRYAHQYPHILCRHPLRCLEALVALDLLSQQEGMLLMRALTLWQVMQNMLRLTLGSATPEGNASLSLQQKLADGVGCLDFHDLRRHMEVTAQSVAELFHLTFITGDYDI